MTEEVDAGDATILRFYELRCLLYVYFTTGAVHIDVQLDLRPWALAVVQSWSIWMR